MLLATHMRELSKAVVFPEHHRELLQGLRKHHRLAVVSNFDYTPTARHVLEREGVADLFETIVVSDEVGWRKPKPVIFELALRTARHRRPARHSSSAIGRTSTWWAPRAWAWPSAWINREAASPLPEGVQAAGVRDPGPGRAGGDSSQQRVHPGERSRHLRALHSRGD